MKPSLAAVARTTLASSIALLFAPMAMAQQGAAAAPAAAAAAPDTAASSAKSTTNLNAVQVTGFRASIQRALEVKRNANSIVDAISAEDIGKFPDTNAAESLSHLPGIAVDRLYGEGEKVSINGTDPALNRVLVNGQTIASGDWGGNPSDTSGRTFNYTLLSPEIIGLMEVYKSSEARIDEGSIGGTVIVHTRRPLDLPANTFRGSLGYQYNDRSDLGDPRVSGLYSWKNESGTFGALISLTHDKKRLSQGGIEFFGYGNGAGIVKNSPGATVTGDGGDIATARLPAAIDTDNFKQTRERNGLQAAAQWKLDEHNELNLTGIYVKGKYDNFSQARFALPTADTDKFTSVNVNNGLITGGTVTGNGYGELDTIVRRTEVQTKSLNLVHDLTFDGWKLETTTGYTSASGGRDPEYLMSYFLNSGGYSFNYGPQAAGLTFDNPAASNWGLKGTTNPACTPGSYTCGAQQAGGIDTSVSHDNERYGQMDLSHDVDWGIFKEVLVGVKFLRHDNGNVAFGNRINTTNPVTLDQFGGLYVPGSVYDGLNVSGSIPQGFPTATQDAVISYLNGQPQGPFLPNYGETFDVHEITKNIYTQFNYELAGFRGNVGLRYVNTSDNSFYYTSTDQGVTYSPTTTYTSYKKLLPSFNVAYDVDDSKTVRLSIAKVLARPRYADLAGQTARDDRPGINNISGGNPFLKPYESVNVDVAGEWYFAPRSLLGAELFYRSVKDYVVNVSTEQDLLNPRSGNIETYAVSQPTNASYARVKGISLLYQQDIAYGFGIQTNYTYNYANTQEGLNLPYLSRNTVNITPFFESGPYSARVVYSYRSQYFTAIGRLNSQDFTSSYRELGFAASYEINKNLSVTANASNLLDSTYYQFSGVKDAPTGFYKNGRLFQVGLNVKL